MKREIISILIVLALIIGVVVGYYGNSPQDHNDYCDLHLEPNENRNESK